MAPLTFVTLPLTLIFITLKLCHQIDWSWWLVLSPTGGHVALYCICGIIIAISERNMSEGEKFRRRYLDQWKR